MTKLVEKGTWEAGFTPGNHHGEAVATPGPTRSSRWTWSYHNHLLLEVLYPRLLPDLAGRRLVEIGSAPGRHLVDLARRFGVDPWGIEHTATGAEVNRQVFAQNGLAPEQIIHGDFFDDTLLDHHAGSFDVVLSRGFLEHFSDPAPTVERHLRLLAPDGVLIVLIPNLRGIYGWWQRRWHPTLLARHNLDLMRLPVFRSAFDHPHLEELVCTYTGTFDTYSLRAGAEQPRVVHHLVRLFHRIQPAANVALRAILRDRGFETEAMSPFLVYIGRYRIPGRGD